MKLLLVIFILIINIGLSGKELPIRSSSIAGDGVEYEIVNDTDADYYFWIDPSPIDGMDVEVVKHIFHRFLFHPQYFEGNMSLGAIATDGNVVVIPDSVNSNQAVAFSFLKKIGPGSSFRVAIPGSSKKQNVYRSRFGFIPVDSCKFNKLDDEFLWGSDALVIDKPYAELIGLIENTDTVPVISKRFPRELNEIDSICITSSGDRAISGRFVIERSGYRMDDSPVKISHDHTGVLDSVFEPVSNIINKQMVPEDVNCGAITPVIHWEITIYAKNGVKQRGLDIRFCGNRYSLPVEKTVTFLRRIKFLEQERVWHKRLRGGGR